MNAAEAKHEYPPSLSEASRSLHAISIPTLGIAFGTDGNTNLLHAMTVSGHRGISVGCRRGGCGVCRIRVLKGSFVAQPMSRERISPEDEGNGIVLACRIAPRSDMVVAPMPLRSTDPRAPWRQTS